MTNGDILLEWEKQIYLVLNVSDVGISGFHEAELANPVFAQNAKAHIGTNRGDKPKSRPKHLDLRRLLLL